MKRIIELSENDYMALKEDGVQNHIALADTVITHSVPYEERQQGEWLDHWSEDLQKMGFRQCSKCKAGYQLYEHGTRKSDLPWIDGQQYTLERIGKFCPNCGAKMQKGEEK